MTSPKAHVQGFSLTSLMVASALSIVIGVMLYQSFFVLKSLWAQQKAYTDTQDVLQTTQRVFDHRLQSAGKLGEYRIGPDYPIEAPAYPEMVTLVKHKGIWLDEQGALSILYSERPVNVTLSGRALRVDKAMPIYQEEGWVLMDAEKSQLVRLQRTNKAQQKIQLIDSFPSHFSENLQLAQVRWYRYSLQETGRIDDKGRAIKALFQQDKFHRTDALVEGIQSLEWEKAQDAISVSLCLQLPSAQAPEIFWHNQWQL